MIPPPSHNGRYKLFPRKIEFTYHEYIFHSGLDSNILSRFHTQCSMNTLKIEKTNFIFEEKLWREVCPQTIYAAENWEFLGSPLDIGSSFWGVKSYQKKVRIGRNLKLKFRFWITAKPGKSSVQMLYTHYFQKRKKISVTRPQQQYGLKFFLL